VILRLINGTAGNSDSVAIYDPANATYVPLGSADLRRKDYTNANVSLAGTTVLMSGSTITMTLGTASGSGYRPPAAIPP
jgi:hypothetical protein